MIYCLVYLFLCFSYWAKLKKSRLTQIMDIIITLPQTIRWEDYQRELDAVVNFDNELLFKVPFLPTKNVLNSKCYLIHFGTIKGYMMITNLYKDHNFICQTTGKQWKGNFIVRSGPFHPLEKEIKMKGFQGWRYLDESILL